MGEDSNRTFKAGVWLERDLEFGTWKGFKGILKDSGPAGCSLLYLATQRTFALLLSLLSTHGVLSGGDAGWGREDFGGLSVW